MKKIYIALLFAMVCGGSAMAGSHFSACKSARTASRLVKAQAQAQGFWLPQTQTEYWFIDGQWINLGTSTFTYDDRGNAILTMVENEDGIMKIETTYDDYNKPVYILTSEGAGIDRWDEVAKTTYKYDSVLHGYAIERMVYDYEGGDWISNFKCETNAITRNASGNITDIVKSLPLGADMIPGYKLSWTYDGDKATGMAYYLNYNADDVITWETYDNTDYRNIQWLKTDGQMTEASLYDYIEGNNVMASCDIYYKDELDGHFYVNYGDDGSYKAVETFADINTVGLTIEKAYIDGGTDYEIITSEYFDESNVPASRVQYFNRVVFHFNDHGDIILNEVSEKYDGRPEEIIAGYEYSYTYDENGNIKEFVQSAFDYDSGEYVEEVKMIYGEYAQFSGLDDIAADADAAVEYFDLQGRRVENPASGLYIRRQGSKIAKVLVK